MRTDGRKHDQVRPLALNVGQLPRAGLSFHYSCWPNCAGSIASADGSALVRCGDTLVICGVKLVIIKVFINLLGLILFNRK